MKNTSKIVEACARASHEANRAYCLAMGDTSLLPWEESPSWQRESVIDGVKKALSDPLLTSAQSHENWLAYKRREAWVYGPVKVAERKTHPCLLPYDELPPAQRAKDAIFLGVVRLVEAALKENMTS